MPLHWKAFIEGYSIPGISPPGPVARYGGDRVLAFAERHATESWGRWKTPEDLYSIDELSRLPVCTKSVNSWARGWLFGILKRNVALKYNSLLLRYQRPLKTVYLIRDAYAVCNGWMRRGCDPYQAGKWYQYIGRKMLQDYARRPDEIMFIRFQDVLNEPVSTVRAAQKFFGLRAAGIAAYHLKTKKVLDADGNHRVRLGAEGSMVWVEAKNLDDFLDADVDSTQRKMLDRATSAAFQRGLGGVNSELDCVCG